MKVCPYVWYPSRTLGLMFSPEEEVHVSDTAIESKLNSKLLINVSTFSVLRSNEQMFVCRILSVSLFVKI